MMIMITTITMTIILILVLATIVIILRIIIIIIIIIITICSIPDVEAGHSSRRPLAVRREAAGPRGEDNHGSSNNTNDKYSTTTTTTTTNNNNNDSSNNNNNNKFDKLNKLNNKSNRPRGEEWSRGSGSSGAGFLFALTAAPTSRGRRDSRAETPATLIPRSQEATGELCRGASTQATRGGAGREMPRQQPSRSAHEVV